MASYNITSWEDLSDLANESGGFTLADDYTLTTDLDSSSAGYATYAGSAANAGSGFLPIGNDTTKFTGSFDGNEHTISDIVISRSGTDNVGFFGYTDGATIQDLTIDNITVDGNSRVGGLIGRASSDTISGCYVKNSDIEGHTSSAADGNVGGFVGESLSSITFTNCGVEDSAVASSGARLGGFVGKGQGGTFTSCYVKNTDVDNSGEDSTGGFVGYVTYTTYSKCYVNGGTVSGIGSAYEVGGFCGMTFNVNGTVFSECWTSAAVDDGHTDVGGFIGYAHSSSGTTIENCYARGAVSQGSDRGGFVGECRTSIKNCFSTGASANGFCGNYVSGTITDCFFDSTTAGVATDDTDGTAMDAGVIPKATADMKDVDTFTITDESGDVVTAWDFVGNPNDDTADNDYWDIDASYNDGYPELSYMIPEEEESTQPGALVYETLAPYEYLVPY